MLAEPKLEKSPPSLLQRSIFYLLPSPLPMSLFLYPCIRGNNSLLLKSGQIYLLLLVAFPVFLHPSFHSQVLPSHESRVLSSKPKVFSKQGIKPRRLKLSLSLLGQTRSVITPCPWSNNVSENVSLLRWRISVLMGVESSRLEAWKISIIF